MKIGKFAFMFKIGKKGFNKGNFNFPLLKALLARTSKEGKKEMKEIELIQKMNELGEALRQMEECKAAFEASVAPLNETIEDLKDELRMEFLALKESKATDSLVVKYRKGAVRWDSAGLKSYAKDHPEIREFQKVGEPTVAFCLPKPEEQEEA